MPDLARSPALASCSCRCCSRWSPWPARRGQHGPVDHAVRAGAARWHLARRGTAENRFYVIYTQRPDALFMVADALTNLNRKRVIEFAATHRILAMYEVESIVQDGGLISYGPRIDDNFRRAAYFVGRIFKGTKPGDLSTEQPTRYYLFVNLKTAKAIGVTIPQSILLRADKVIE